MDRFCLSRNMMVNCIDCASYIINGPVCMKYGYRQLNKYFHRSFSCDRAIHFSQELFNFQTINSQDPLEFQRIHYWGLFGFLRKAFKFLKRFHSIFVIVTVEKALFSLHNVHCKCSYKQNFFHQIILVSRTYILLVT